MSENNYTWGGGEREREKERRGEMDRIKLKR